MKSSQSMPRVEARMIAFLLLLCFGLMAGMRPALAALPDPNQGPGGPILVLTSANSTFGKYYAEILRTEGFNEFAVADISTVTSITLAAYDVVILAANALAPDPLTKTLQVTMLTTWVNAGGNLIAMQPDPQLYSLLGLTNANSTLTNAHLLIDTSKQPGTGLVNQTIQFHGSATLFTPNNGTSSLATLYANATTATANPAVTLRSVGIMGGQAAAFAYDLATSIAYSRQGNPAWAAQERDGLTPIRSDDKFYGAASGDVQPDWVDLSKASIPQADEQQRFLANLILQMNLDKKPLPRFWYFPNNKKAVIVMTGDDHDNGGTGGRFDQYVADSPAGCSVANWDCVRGTSYVYPGTPITNPGTYDAEGFEIGVHITTNCLDFTPTSLDSNYSTQLPQWSASFPTLPAPSTERHHCIVWSDWLTGAKTELKYGMRLDVTYYYWPSGWMNDQPGFFTSSGMPMRYVDLNGTLVDVYNVETEMTDESGQSYPGTVNALLDGALGSAGYYGAFVVNAHTDTIANPVSDAVVAAAQARGVSVIASRQLLQWLDSRNSSSFNALSWSNNALTFTVTPGADANGVPVNGLEVMVPEKSAAGVLTGITRSGTAVSYTTQTIKGIAYATFLASGGGTFVASYATNTTAPTVTAKSPADGATTVSVGTTVTATFSKALDASTINGSTFTLQGPSGPVTATVSYDSSTFKATLTPTSGLAYSTTYTATVKGGATGGKDLSGNALANNVTWTFTTAAGPTTCPCSLWPASATPFNWSANDSSSVELGVRFQADVNGTITGIRFYKGPGNTGPHVGTLWSSTGTPLASITFSGETAEGWQTASFSVPVAITANTVYVASYHAPAGHYAADANYFANSVDNPPLHALKNGVSGGNGVYSYSSTTSFPTNTYQSSNYWVDVVFVPGAAPTLTAIAVTPANPTIAVGATQQFTATGTYSDSSTKDITSQVTWTSSNTTVATISTAGLATGQSAGTATIQAVQGSVSGNTALAVQSAPLAVTTTTLPSGTVGTAYSASLTASGGTPPYTWTLASGALPAGLNLSSSGTISGTPTTAGTASFTVQVTDSANPAATANQSLSIAIPDTIWPSTAVPATPDSGPDSAVELGVKFQSDVNGHIYGIRFYKASTNTGTHVGNLWSSSGQLLASATFTNETASGWQQVTFASPVSITANTVYVASYHTTGGHYSADQNYFATAGVDNPPLHALANGVSGFDGVYAYGTGSSFPTQGFNASNYWVDVLFSN